jgi:EipB-like
MIRSVTAWTTSRLAVAAVCGGLLCGTAGAAFADGPADILPHRAGYELTLKSVRSGSGVIDVTGVLSYDWSDSCDGWIVEQRYVLQVVRGDGPVVEISASYANWESKDGLRYRFYVKRSRGGEDEDQSTEIQGEAQLDGKGLGGVAHFEKPQKQDIKLQPGTLFPTAHTLMLMQQARAGAKFDRHPVFDGAEVEGPSLMTSFLLPQRATVPGGTPPVLTAVQPVWPASIAVFPPDANAETPNFQMTIYLQPNGVVPELTMDYGDFTVLGRMKIFQKLKKPEC